MERAAITRSISNTFFLPSLSEIPAQKRRPKELNPVMIITPATAASFVSPLSGCRPRIFAMGIIIDPAAVAHINAKVTI